MRKVFWSQMVSLDGFMEGPNRELDWHVVDEDFTKYVEQMGEEIDTIVFGRVTYEMMASYWPTATEPEAPMMNDLPKIVFSRTLERVDWKNSRLAKGSPREEIARLKERPGKDIAIFGSSQLASSMLREGLIDELRIFLAPLLLGRGSPTFKNVEKASLRLLGARTSPAGNVVLTYAPNRAS